MKLALASVIKDLICLCFSRNPFRSAKNIGCPKEGKYPPDSMFCHNGLPATPVEISTILTKMWKWDWREGLSSKKIFQGRNYPKVKWMRVKPPCNTGQSMEPVYSLQCAREESLACTAGSRGSGWLTHSATLKGRSKAWLLAVLNSC